jgi:tRNA threonylcarbamoyladenosine biosynthesis protein TsaE
LGQELAQELAGATIVCLYGELGSGKTTFSQGFAKGLGINHRLLSPTFIIVRRYEVPQTIRWFYHVDLYRIKGDIDIEGVGLPEIFTDPSAIVLIEWADRLGKFLPKKRIDIRFAVNGDGSHQLWMSQQKQ